MDTEITVLCLGSVRRQMAKNDHVHEARKDFF